MPPTIRYPSGPVTPHGAYHIINDRTPQVGLRSYDDTILFNLMGGLAIPDRATAPERVEIKALKGLVGPWTTIDQKGATQDGITFVDSLQDPIEVEMDVVCHGRDPAHCRKVENHLIASIDAKQESELWWFTHEMGRWWTKVRWFKNPANPTFGGSRKREEKALRLRADSGFWQSYPYVAGFSFIYDGMKDEFNTGTTSGMGANYDLVYSGTGGGYVRVMNGQLVWIDDPDDPILTDGRTAVFRRKSFDTETNHQVIETTLGSFNEWSFPDNGATIIGGRMPLTGTAGDTGVFAEIGANYAAIRGKVGGSIVFTTTRPVLIPPLPGEKWTLVLGYPGAGNERVFKLKRDFALGITIDVLTYKDAAAVTSMGPTYRGVGGGMHAGAAFLTQATPASMRYFQAGDNNEISQTKFLKRINAGDQPMWDTITFFGPGKVRVGNGPNSTDMVEFGPLLPGQIAQIRTDPRKYGVKDLTTYGPAATPTGPQKDLLQQVLSFITFNDVTHILDVFQSLFGLLGGGSTPAPPQGNLYMLLKGRFSRPIPPKPAGRPAEVHHVKVEMVGGNADSKVIMSGIPLRRNPY